MIYRHIQQTENDGKNLPLTRVSDAERIQDPIKAIRRKIKIKTAGKNSELFTVPIIPRQNLCTLCNVHADKLIELTFVKYSFEMYEATRNALQLSFVLEQLYKVLG